MLGNASFVNETKVLDSELNYVVSVIVNNDAQAMTEEMEFQDIPALPLDRFTGTLPIPLPVISKIPFGWISVFAMTCWRGLLL